MTLKKQIELIGLDKLIALDRLKVLIPSFMITGSISLICRGIYNRKCNDIDIIVSDFSLLDNLGPSVEVEYTFDYIDFPEDTQVSNFKGEKPNRVSFRINNVKICAFERPDIKEFDSFKFNGNLFKVVPAEYSIKSKQEFIRNYFTMAESEPLLTHQIEIIKKHFDDILIYLRFRTYEDSLF